jgi:hypothetical protein
MINIRTEKIQFDSMFDDVRQNIKETPIELQFCHKSIDKEFCKLMENLMRKAGFVDTDEGLSAPVNEENGIIQVDGQTDNKSADDTVHTTNQISDNLEVVTKDFSKLVASRLPIPEPEIFKGDPLKFPIWKSSFIALIEREGIPPAEKIYYLQRYLQGEARESIEGMFY